MSDKIQDQKSEKSLEDKKIELNELTSSDLDKVSGGAAKTLPPTGNIPQAGYTS